MQIRARYCGDSTEFERGKVYTLVISRDQVSIGDKAGYIYDLEDFLNAWLPLKPGD